MRACLSSNQQRTPRGTITPTEDAAALVGLNRMLLSRCFHMPLGNRFWLRFDRHCNRLRPVEVLRWALCFSISQRQRKRGAIMRMMLKIKMPTDSGNRAIKDRSLGKLLRHGQQTEGGGCLFCCRGRCPMRADFFRHEGFGGDTGHSRTIVHRAWCRA